MVANARGGRSLAEPVRQAQADDGRGDAADLAASAVLPTDNRDLAAAKRTAAVGDRIPTGVRAGWWRPCRADTCGCPIAAASISSTTATGTDPTARAMCWSCRPAGARPQPAALCGAGLAGQRAVLLAAGTYYLWHADTREYEVVSRRGQRDPFIRSAGRPPATTWWPTRARPGARPAGPRPLRVPPLGGGRERLRPGGATYAPAAEVANGYRRAMAACLSGRGYSVN